MLILQIAAAIVVAVVVLRHWPVILGGGVMLIVALVVFVLLANLMGTELAALAILASLALAVDKKGRTHLLDSIRRLRLGRK